jgi:hypothetical protein
MLRQHQDSLLPAVKQGVEGHEALHRPGIVSVNSVSHATDFHVSYPFVALRAANTGRKQGGERFYGLRIW